jgi:hypothetical protein
MGYFLIKTIVLPKCRSLLQCCSTAVEGQIGPKQSTQKPPRTNQSTTLEISSSNHGSLNSTIKLQRDRHERRLEYRILRSYLRRNFFAARDLTKKRNLVNRLLNDRLTFPSARSALPRIYFVSSITSMSFIL